MPSMSITRHISMIRTGFAASLHQAGCFRSIPYLFTKKPFRLGGQSLLKIFPAKTTGLGQRAIYNELMAVKNFRNRIAHHEPICFDSNGSKSYGFAKEHYDLIVRYVNFLGYPEDHLYVGLDVLPDSILERINKL